MGTTVNGDSGTLETVIQGVDKSPPVNLTACKTTYTQETAKAGYFSLVGFSPVSFFLTVFKSDFLHTYISCFLRTSISEKKDTLGLPNAFCIFYLANSLSLATPLGNTVASL